MEVAVAMTMAIAVSAWLAYVAVADLRTVEVTNWATVPPLLAVTAWRALMTDDGYPVGLALALFLIGSQWPTLAAPALAGMVACLTLAAPVGLEVVVAVWVFCFVLWRLGVIGGADAKVVMALTALFPDGRLAWLLLLAWFGLSLVYLVARHGRSVPRSLLQAARGLVKLRVLSEEEDEKERYPALPAVALAGLAYLWFYL